MASQETTVLRDQTYRACHRLALLRALQGYYIIAGQEPTIAQRGAGANMSVDVGAFKYLYAGVFGEKSTTTNVVIDTSDATNPRIDQIYLGSGGTISVSKGTARAVKPVGETTWQKYEEPYPADLSGTAGILLAEVLVPAGATTIVDAYIRNVVITEALALYFASEARGDLIYRNATTWARLAGVERGSILYEGADLDPAWLVHGAKGLDLQCGGHGANPEWGKSPWVQESNFTARPPSTSTITMTADMTGTIKVGMGLKYTWNGTTYYGIVSAIAADLLTVAGAPLSTSYDVTALYWCPQERVVQVDFFVAGKFADAANTGLLASDMNTKFDWNLGKAYCVLIRHTVKTDDSGANQPQVTLSIAGSVVGTDNTNAGQAVAETWTSTVVGINTSNYDINPDEAIEVVTDANGTNDDAENLTVSAVFVLE